jgi:hypothetical protein
VDVLFPLSACPRTVSVPIGHLGLLEDVGIDARYRGAGLPARGPRRRLSRALDRPERTWTTAQVIPPAIGFDPLFVRRDTDATPVAPDFEVGLFGFRRGALHFLLSSLVGCAGGAFCVFMVPTDRLAAVIGLLPAVRVRACQQEPDRGPYRPLALAGVQAEENGRLAMRARHAQVPSVV